MWNNDTYIYKISELSLSLSPYLSLSLLISDPLTVVLSHHITLHTTTHTHRFTPTRTPSMHDTSTTNIVNEANRMRKMVPERFYEMVVMHLSILLDLNGVLLSELETSLSQTSVGKTPSSSGRHSKSASRKPIKG